MLYVGTYELYERHTAYYIGEVLEEALLAVITDNGANMVLAIFDTFGKAKHRPCFAHTLN